MWLKENSVLPKPEGQLTSPLYHFSMPPITNAPSGVYQHTVVTLDAFAALNDVAKVNARSAFAAFVFIIFITLPLISLFKATTKLTHC